jgi:hypothetical protein
MVPLVRFWFVLLFDSSAVGRAQVQFFLTPVPGLLTWFWSSSQIPLARPVRRFCSCLRQSLISAQQFFQPHEPALIQYPAAWLLLPATVRSPVSSISPLLCCHSKHFDFGYRSSISLVLCFGLLQLRTGIVLELPNQKAQVFLVLIAFTRWFSEHARKVFSEMTMRTWTNFWSDSCHHSLARVLASINSGFRCDSRVHNLVPRASSLSIAM